MIEAIGVGKRFAHCMALQHVDLRVDAGEVVAIVGPSGSGKSTLLRCLNGLETITSGEVRVDGRVLASRSADGTREELSRREARELRAELGMVFQRFNLFPHLTAVRNVMVAPIHVRNEPAQDARAHAEMLLDKVNLGHRIHHYPDELSGGEQQRVAIARALAMRPKAMLFDEATSALDPETVGDVLAVMRSLATEGMTMVVVTHEIPFAREVADRAVIMEGGRVIEEGSAIEVLTRPRSDRARAFLHRVLDPRPVSRRR